MRLAYISDSALPSRQANGVQVIRMCNAFADNGHDVVLYARKSSVAKTGSDDIFRYYGARPAFQVHLIKSIRGRIGRVIYASLAALKARASEVDIIYCRSLLGCYLGVLLGCWAVIELHSYVYAESRMKALIFRRLIRHRKLLRIVFISDALRKIYADHHALGTGMTIVAHDGADRHKNDNTLKMVRRSDRLQVGYVGHLYDGRGIEIIAELARVCSWADFTIVGGLERDISRWRASVAGIKNCSFVGHVPPSNVVSYIQNSDVLLAPYQKVLNVGGGRLNTSSWMSPLKIFEYMSAGKAILCSDLLVLNEILTHDESAIMCDPESIDEWVRALERLRESKSFRMSLGAAARRRFLEHYTWERRAMKVLSGIHYE